MHESESVNRSRKFHKWVRSKKVVIHEQDEEEKEKSTVQMKEEENSEYTVG